MMRKLSPFSCGFARGFAAPCAFVASLLLAPPFTVTQAQVPQALVLPPIAPAIEQLCLSGAQTRTAIASEEIISLQNVQEALKARGFSEVSSARVCPSAGGLVYRVFATNGGGRSARFMVDGASGAVLSQE